MAHKRSTAPLHFAHKRSSTSAWHPKFTPGWLTKGLLHWNSKFYPRVAHKTKACYACYVGMATSSSKFKPRKANKRFATLEWRLLRLNFTVRVAHKKGLLRLLIKSLLQCVTGCMTRRFPNHLERVLPRKYRPKDPKTRKKDQRTKGPGDQGTRGPRQRDQRTKRPGNQQTRTKGVGGMFFLIQITVIVFVERNPCVL